MKESGHAHAISIQQSPNRLTVFFNGVEVAKTDKALLLKEGPLPPAHYIPREDVRMDYLTRTTHSTHCPFKGNAAYYSVNIGGKTAENAVWTYETPIDSVAVIKGYVSFYAEKMDAIEEGHKE